MHDLLYVGLMLATCFGTLAIIMGWWEKDIEATIVGTLMLGIGATLSYGEGGPATWFMNLLGTFGTGRTGSFMIQSILDPIIIEMALIVGGARLILNLGESREFLRWGR